MLSGTHWVITCSLVTLNLPGKDYAWFTCVKLNTWIIYDTFELVQRVWRGLGRWCPGPHHESIGHSLKIAKFSKFKVIVLMMIEVWDQHTCQNSTFVFCFHDSSIHMCLHWFHSDSTYVSVSVPFHVWWAWQFTDQSWSWSFFPSDFIFSGCGVSQSHRSFNTISKSYWNSYLAGGILEMTKLWVCFIWN